MKRGRKWIRKGAQVTLGSGTGGTIAWVVGAAAAIRVDDATAKLFEAGGSSVSPPYYMASIARDSEGTDWIRGWHKPESPALKALLAAYSLKERAA